MLIAACSFGPTAGYRAGDVQPGAEDTARTLLHALLSKNSGLCAYKGIGNLRIRKSGAILNARMAWVAAIPDKFRAELFGLPGRQIARLASDGTRLYIDAGNSGKIHIRNASNSLFQHILPLDISPREMVALLAGRVPVLDVDMVALHEDPEGKGYALHLSQHWWGVRQIIRLASSGNGIRSVEAFTRSGRLRYRVNYLRMEKIGNYTVPMELSFGDGQTTDVRLDIQRYWTDVSVQAAQFRLEPPMSNP